MHRAIGEGGEPTQILQKACGILAGNRGYVHVWMGLLTPGKAFPELIASQGSATAVPSALLAALSVPEVSCILPCTRALSRKEATVLKDIAAIPDLQLRALLQSHGVCSLASLPMKYQEQCYGLLCFCAGQCDVFQSEEMELLQEIANDLAFAVFAFESSRERIRAEAELRLQSAALASAANGILITDRDGTIRWANTAMYSLSGYSAQELIGQNPRIFKSGCHDAGFYAHLWRELAAGHVFRGEMINRRKDGKLVEEEEVTITPVADERGQISHYIAIKQDVSDRKRLQEQLVQSQKMEVIGRLAGGIAHDFNNLLMIILGYCDNLCSNPIFSGGRHELEQIDQAAQRAASLTQQLLAFSRKQPLELKSIDLNSIMPDTMKMLKRVIGEDVRVQLEVSAEPLTIKADRHQVEQVMMNLMVNARDAMPGGGTMTISTSQVCLSEAECRKIDDAVPGMYACVSIRDSGKGMDTETIQHIFEPFFTTKGPFKGTGLGLAVVYGIVRQHGGFVEVESQLECGTEFRVFFPLLAGPQPVAATPDSSGPRERRKGNNELVLFVEDEESIRELVERFLRRANYRVVVAEHAEQAARLFTEYRSDIKIVITDVVLPGKSGLELAQELRKDSPHLPFILCSGYSDGKSRWEEIKAQGFTFLQKPYTIDVFLQLLRDTLDVSPNPSENTAPGIQI